MTKAHRVTILTGVIVAFAAAGFIFKIWEFVRSLSDANAMGFAIVPLSSYFLTGTGFLLLLGWSISRGAFRDIEAPKYTMIERERALAVGEGEDDAEWELAMEAFRREDANG